MLENYVTRVVYLPSGNAYGLHLVRLYKYRPEGSSYRNQRTMYINDKYMKSTKEKGWLSNSKFWIAVILLILLVIAGIMALSIYLIFKGNNKIIIIKLVTKLGVLFAQFFC